MTIHKENSKNEEQAESIGNGPLISEGGLWRCFESLFLLSGNNTPGEHVGQLLTSHTSFRKHWMLVCVCVSQQVGGQVGLYGKNWSKAKKYNQTKLLCHES